MFMSKRPIDTWGLLETFIDDALDGFYGYMDSDDDLSPFMDGRNIGRLKKTQRDHWQATFKDGYNNAYYERLHRIGTAHARIGLPPHYFVRGYRILLDSLYSLGTQKGRLSRGQMHEVARKLSDVILHDLEVGIEIYYQILNDGKRHTAQGVLNHSEEFATRMHQLSNEVQSIATAVTQMDSSINNISANVDETTRFAQAASSKADSAAASMHSVSSASEEIGSFLSIITEIADKTKLLTVNAAIEAARAGEAGKGFTVVADEVRQLAEGTEAGAKDVANKVEEIQNAVSGLRRTIESVQESFAHVLSASDKIASAVHQQSASSREMSSRMSSVRSGIEEQITDLDILVEGVHKSLQD